MPITLKPQSVYPLPFRDGATGKSYLIESWDNDLRVFEQPYRVSHETFYHHSFFVGDGEFSDELKAELPMIWLDWVKDISGVYREPIAQLNGWQTAMPQLMMIRLMRHQRDFYEWVCQLASTQDGGYLKLVWTLAEIENHPLPVQEAFLLSLPGQPRAEFLSRLSGVTLTKSQALKTRKVMLDRLPSSRPEVMQFLQLLSNPTFNTLLADADFVRLGAIAELKKLPEWLWIGKVWQSISWLPHFEIARIFPPLILEAQPAQQKQIQKALAQVAHLDELEHTLWLLVNQLAQNADFPEPPLAGNNLLKPITSGKALKAEGKAMQHCVGGYSSDVVKGNSYFYHWAGDSNLPLELTLQLKPQPKSSQWFLYEALGFKNQTIKPQDWVYLKQQLANLNEPWGYLLHKTPIAGLMHHDFDQAWSNLMPFQALKLQLEADNLYDATAIAILTPEGLKLGYVPQDNKGELLSWLQQNAALKVRLNYLKPQYATISIYLAPAE